MTPTYILIFLSGAAVAAILAALVAVRMMKSRSVRVKMETEAKYVAEQARLSADLANARTRIGELEKSVSDERAMADEKVAGAKKEWEADQSKVIDAMQKRFDETVGKMQEQLKNTTDRMLKERQDEFSKTSRESIGQYIESVRKDIEEMRAVVKKGDENLAERSGEMRQQIKDLMSHSDAARKSADELATALKKGNKVQGDWGELKLTELLESQGLVEGIHFDTQKTLRDAGGKAVRDDDDRRKKPDLVLHLDECREIVIDSKVSISSYIDYINADTEDARQAALKAHLASIRKHVKELAEQDYSAYVRPPKVSAGYVIMFVPNSGALWTALDADSTLWRKAADSNVIICDEQSLYGALKVVSLTWTQITQVQNQKKVFELADEVVKRIGMFQKYFGAIGDAIKEAGDKYDEGFRKMYEGRQTIGGAARKLLDLGVRESREYPLKPILGPSGEDEPGPAAIGRLEDGEALEVKSLTPLGL